MMNKMSKQQWIIVGVIFLVGIFLGWLLAPSPSGQAGSPADRDTTAVSEGQVWTCSMHPQIRQNEPGKCPICGMDLIPLEVEESQKQVEGITLSRNALEVANIQFAVVQRRQGTKTLRLPAVVAPDERQLLRLTSHVPSARIEELYVNFEGAFVQAGQPVAKIYSPEIIAAHRELLVALRENQPLLLETIRQKFRNWKFTEQQIAALERSQELQSTVEILSPVSGHVLKLNVREGDHPKEGDVIMEIANLSTVWVWLDVYEQDLPFVRVGMPVSFQFDALPGKTFEGRIAYIEPTVNETTRSVPVQVEIPNPGLQLRPGMYGVATVYARRGSVMTIPKTAVLWTGERSLVYVKAEQQEDRVVVVPRMVRLGADLEDAVEVLDGLQEGEEVVANGTFIVDASAQLAGFVSMMNPTGGQSAVPHHHGGHAMPQQSEAKHSQQAQGSHQGAVKLSANQITALLQGYNQFVEALVASSLPAAQKAAQRLIAIVQQHSQVQKAVPSLQQTLKKLEQAQTLKDFRAALDPLSRQLQQLLKHQSLPKPVYVLQCPMAFDNREGYWLSPEPVVKNPYFGEQMLSCGSVVDTLRSRHR